VLGFTKLSSSDKARAAGKDKGASPAPSSAPSTSASVVAASSASPPNKETQGREEKYPDVFLDDVESATPAKSEKNNKDGDDNDNEKANDIECCACQDEEPHQYPDGGYGWVVVACCTVLCALTNGWGMSYGVFQEVSARAGLGIICSMDKTQKVRAVVIVHIVPWYGSATDNSTTPNTRIQTLRPVCSV